MLLVRHSPPLPCGPIDAPRDAPLTSTSLGLDTLSVEPRLNEAVRPKPHLLHVFPTFVAAGAQTRTVALIESFGSRFRHSLLALDGRSDALALLPDGLAVSALEAPRAGGALGALLAARALLARMRPELVLTYNWGSFDYVLAARSQRRAFLHIEDGFNADEAHGQKRRRVLARRWVLPGARRVIVPSTVLETCAREQWRLPPGLVRRIPNGVRLERFGEDPEGRARVRAELSIPAAAFVVGAVGHLRPVKNLGLLMRACAALPADLARPGVHLVILGDGPERERLLALARELTPPGGRIHMPGHQRELRPWYAAMDVFCLSSHSEQLPVSLLEAMSCGRACVSTDVGDVRAVLPPEAAPFLIATGRGVAEEESVRAFARALDALARDPSARDALARLGHERCRTEYAFDAMTRAHLEEIERALA